jgi:acetylornithine/succinyldiaminopimelate/putrescine aminotransferase
VVDAAREMGVLINCTAGKVIRIVPPLVIKKEEIDAAVDVLGHVISDL